jgi:hypothetical protein
MQKYFPKMFFNSARIMSHHLTLHSSFVFSPEHLNGGMVATFLALLHNNLTQCTITLRESPILFVQEDDIVRNFLNISMKLTAALPPTSSFVESSSLDNLDISHFWVRIILLEVM